MSKYNKYQDMEWCRNEVPKFAEFRFIGYVLLSIAFFIGFFHRFAPATFAGVISNDLNVSATALGAIASMHFWIYTIMQIPAGTIVDKYGIRKSVFWGTLLTAIGSAILSQADSFGWALVGPAMVGLGISSVFVGIMKYNSIWFSPEKYGLITGVTMLIGTAGSVFSEGPASLFLEIYSWRSIFLSVALLTLVVSLLILFSLYDSPKELNQGRKSVPGRSLKTIASIDYSIFKNKQLWCLLLCTAGTNGTLYAFAGLWGVPLLENSFNIDHNTAVNHVTLSLIVYGIGSLLIGAISDKVGKRKPFILFSSLLGTFTWAWMALMPWAATWQGWFFYALLGLSGAQVVVAFSAVKESVDGKDAGISLALVNTGVFLTSAIVQFIFGYLLDSVTSYNKAYVFEDYKIALLLPSVLCLLGTVGGIFTRESYPQ